MAPHIYNNEKYSVKDLVLGDFFSIGITLLELAFSDYIPKQNDLDEIKVRLAKLGETSVILSKILDTLLFPSKHNLRKSWKSWTKLERQYSHKDSSVLEKYGNGFKDYLESDSQKSAKIIQKNDGHPPAPQNRQGPNDQELAELRLENAFRDPRGIIKGMESAAERHREASGKAMMLICYENIAKEYLCNQQNTKAFAEFCDKILSELKNDESIGHSPLLFSTLGIHFYLQNNIEEARSSFIRGLKEWNFVFHDETKLLLLVNYAYILLNQENYKDEYKQTIKEIWTLLSLNTHFKFLETLDLETIVVDENSYEVQYFSVKDSPIHENRYVELLLSRVGSIFEQKPNVADFRVRSTSMNALFENAFFHLCFYKVGIWRRVLRNDEKQVILSKLDNFVSYFYSKTNWGYVSLAKI